MIHQLHFQIDERSGVPVYRQIMDQVKYYIAGGTLRLGDQLPSIRELASALTVNPTTIVKSYFELEQAGVLEMRQGKGAFISLKAGQITLEEQENALRRSARHLAVEAIQLHVTSPRVIDVVREELDAVNPSYTDDNSPVKFSASAQR
ncbi:MAG: GntR family transcriptional regulator [Pedosphaera sp.]|nr:GntR family transcriptional regulator [Pedosphaera sp.]